ncbi:MAG: amidophosphoribosyltransferase, partial [Bacteroidia bacterium]|nr:amidophosphoribosyltransferase [Bacteroidia bacterium]
MSDSLTHECGLGLIRLKHPLRYYLEKYGSPLYGLYKMYMLMEKQLNRGQDGAGIAVLKLNAPKGYPYFHRSRCIEPSPPWQTLFRTIEQQLKRLLEKEPNLLSQPEQLQLLFPYAGEILMAHLRYGTHGDNSIDACHPVFRSNN